jgi:hypothetical protein
MALNGISALIAVTQMKVDAANADAISQSVKQQGTRPALHQALYAAADNFGHVKAAGQNAQLSSIKSKFDSAGKDLEAQDKLGNFEIQDLMSTYNEAQTLASSVRKKLDDTASAVIGKI